MPEAPEVETVRRTLERQLKGHQITGVSITHPKLADNMPASEMEEKLTGEHLNAFHRLGKYLILETDHYDWVAHMRMEGKFLVMDELPEDEKIRKHTHAVFDLDNGKKLCYVDTRKFGRMDLYDKAKDFHALPALKKTGLDVLDQKLTGEALNHRIHKRNIPIKTALLDQSVIAGIGNIYADEICFAAGLDPRSVCSHLDVADCTRIVQAAKEIIEEAIKHKGTTILTFSSDNHPGEFQNFLKVHVQEGKPCSICESTIERIKVNNRSTYLCPSCQKLK